MRDTQNVMHNPNTGAARYFAAIPALMIIIAAMVPMVFRPQLEAKIAAIAGIAGALAFGVACVFAWRRSKASKLFATSTGDRP